MKTKMLAIAFIGAVSLANAQTSTNQFKVIKSIPVSGNGGWDFLEVNPTNHFIYASHSDKVNIINPETTMSEGIIENQNGVHGITFDNENRGYITNGKSNMVYVFDVKTNEKITEIKVGTKPDAIIFDKFSGKIIVANAGSNDLSIINPKNFNVEKTIKLTGNPEVLVTNLKGKIYVNIEDQAKIAEINVKTGEVLNYFSLGKDTGPTGLAIDLKTNRLFAGCEEHLVIVNAENGKIVNALPIGEGCDGVAFDAKTKTVFASTGSGVLSNYLEKSANEFVKSDDIKTEPGARTIAIDEWTQKIYVPTAEYGIATDKNAKRLPLKDGTFHILEIGL